MDDHGQGKDQLLAELALLRSRVAELEHQSRASDARWHSSPDFSNHTELHTHDTGGNGHSAVSTDHDRFTALINALPYPLYVINAGDYSVRLANAAALSSEPSMQPGCKERSRSQGKLCDGIDGMNGMGNACLLFEVKRSRQVLVYEHLHTDIHGEYRICETHGCPVFDRAGNVAELIVYCCDVTDRKRKEMAARPSDETKEQQFRERLASLIKVGNELSRAESFDELCRLAIELGLRELGFDRLGLHIWNHERTHVHGTFGTDETGRVRDERGYTQKIEARDWETVVNNDPAFVLRSSNWVLSNGKGEPVGTGSHAWVPLWNGKRVIGFLAADDLLNHRGIDDQDCQLLTLYASQLAYLCTRMWADQAVRESENRYRSFIETANEGVWAVDSECRTTFVNQKMVDMLGYSVEEMLGRSLKEFLFEEDSRKLEERLRRRRSGAPETYEGNYRHRSGEVRTLLVSVSPTTDTEGNFTGSFAMCTDITERKRSEQALRKTQERLELALNGAELGLWDWNIGTGELVLNRRWAEMLGYPFDDIRSDFSACAELVHPEDGPRVMAALNAHLDGSTEMYEVEHRLKTRTGQWRWVLARGRVVERDANGNPLRAAGTHLDITDRKQAEEAVRIDESRLEALVSLNQMESVSIPDISDYALAEAVRLTESKIGYVAFMNEDESILSMQAWSKSAMQECRVANQPIDYRVEDTGLWGEAVRQRRAVITNDYEAPNPFKKGTPEGHVVLKRHMNIPIFDGDRIVLVAGVGNKPSEYDESDVRQLTLLMTGLWRIIQRKQSEQTIRDNEERFRTLTEASLTGVFVIQNDRFRYVNPTFAQIFCYSPREIVGSLDPLGLVHDDERPIVADHIRRGIAGEIDAAHFTTKGVRKDGTVIWCEVMARRIEYQGRPSIVGSLLDISERMRAEEERSRLEVQLRQVAKMDAVGTLASGIAHDFNNLLTAIFGYASVARKSLPPNHTALQAIDMIEEAGRQASGVANSLLTFSRKTQATKSTLNLAVTLQESLRLLRRVLPAAIEMVQDVSGTQDIWIHGDPTQIQQVIMNLVVNARDAMPNGGRLKISLRHDSTPDLRLPKAYRRFGRAILIVEDTGIGMSEDVLSHIFEPFFTTKPRGHGTGLGTSVIHGIVTDHRGVIDVNSTPGQGTRFTVTLPCCEAPDSESIKPWKERIARGRGQLVLLAEDNEHVRSILTSALRSAGYAVAQAGDGPDAVSQFTAQIGSIRMAILDVDLPGLGGLECMKELRSQSPELPIILVTGSAMSDIESQCDERTELLRKPFPMSGLIAAVNRQLRSKQRDEVVS